MTMSDAHEEILAEFLEYEPELRGLSDGLSNDGQDADDLVQDTFLTAVRHPPKDNQNLRAWLRAVLANLAKRQRRSRARRDYWESKAARTNRLEDHSGEVAVEEYRRVVRLYVEGLPEPYRTVVSMRFLEELSTHEVATRLDKPVNTIKSQITRGLERLRERLQAEHGDEFAGIAMVLLLGLWRPGGEVIPDPSGATHEGSAVAKAGARFALFAGVIVLIPWIGVWLLHRPGGDGVGVAQTARVATLEQKTPLPERELMAEVVGENKPERAAFVPVVEETPPVTDQGLEPHRLRVRRTDGTSCSSAELFISRGDPTRTTRDCDWESLGRADDAGELDFDYSSDNLWQPYLEMPVIATFHAQPRVGLFARHDELSSRIYWLDPEWLNENTLDMLIRDDFPDLHVVTVDPGGAPVVNAKVEVYSMGEPQALHGGAVLTSRRPRSTRTDAEGRAILRSISAGGRLALVHDHWGRYAEILAPTSEDRVDRRVAMRPGSTLGGQALDTSGRPVQGARVTALLGSSPLHQVGTDGSGRFEMTGMPTGVPIPMMVKLSSAGGSAAEFGEVVLTPGEEAQWSPVLDLGRQLRFRLIDSDGIPQPQVQVALVSASRPGWLVRLASGPDGICETRANLGLTEEITLHLVGADGMPQVTSFQTVEGLELTTGTASFVLPLRDGELLCDSLQIGSHVVSTFTVRLQDVSTLEKLECQIRKGTTGDPPPIRWTPDLR